MKLTISMKLLLLVFLSVALSIASTLLVSSMSVSEGFDREMMSSIKASQKVFQDKIDSLSVSYKQLALAQSVRPNVIKSVAAADGSFLKKLGQDLIAAGQTDFIVFVDAKGVVLARGHDDKAGDSIASQDAVKNALTGKNTVSLEPGSVVRLSLRAAAPVRDGDKIVGAVIVGANITHNDKFVDAMKALLDEEATIFWGNVRESTTIMVDGKRALGTKMENPAVLDAVLAKKQAYYVTITLFNRPYYSVYWPILNAEGQAAGMFFLGKDMAEVNASKDVVYKDIALVGLVSLAVLCLAGFFVARRISLPIKRLSGYSEQIAAGDFSASLEVTSKDEVGLLARNMKSMVETLKKQMAFSEGVMRGVAVPFSVFSAEDLTVFTNKAMLDVMDIPGKPEDYYGKQSGEYIWGQRKDTVSSAALREKRLQVADRTLPTRKGREIHVRISSSPFFDQEGVMLGTVSIWLDQTEAIVAKQEAERAKTEGMLQAAAQLEDVVNIVSTASEQLSAQIEQSSRGADEQAGRMTETATAMEEMNATVLEVARNASQAASTANAAKERAQTGSGIVARVIQGIGQVQAKAGDMKTDMVDLGKRADGIGQVLNVISDIADQTNLLALNAAIEAARAGEAGRGFAVVADEVRKLAEKTMNATKEVGDAIRGIQQSAMTNINNVERSVKQIDEATDLSNQSGEALREIVSLVEQTTDQVRSIAAASEEQSSASEEINRSIEEVNRISSETADAMKQSSLAVGELAQQTQALNALIEEFKGGGAKALGR